MIPGMPGKATPATLRFSFASPLAGAVTSIETGQKIEGAESDRWGSLATRACPVLLRDAAMAQLLEPKPSGLSSSRDRRVAARYPLAMTERSGLFHAGAPGPGLIKGWPIG